MFAIYKSEHPENSEIECLNAIPFTPGDEKSFGKVEIVGTINEIVKASAGLDIFIEGLPISEWIKLNIVSGVAAKSGPKVSEFGFDNVESAIVAVLEKVGFSRVEVEQEKKQEQKNEHHTN